MYFFLESKNIELIYLYNQFILLTFCLFCVLYVGAMFIFKKYIVGSIKNKLHHHDNSSSKEHLSQKHNNKVLHTEKEKKQYGKLEKEIKCTLNELLLLSRIHLAWEATSRGLSITKDFGIRELTKEENDKYLANPANIKRATLEYNEKLVKAKLFDLLERNIKDEAVQQKYKEGITTFFSDYLSTTRAKYIKNHLLYKKFLIKYHQEHKKNSNAMPIEKFNVIAKLGNILQERLGSEAFDIVDKNGQETIELSQKSLKYIASIFYNVNAVWKQWWGDLNQVFHDGDFPFIEAGEIKTFDAYVDVFCYLLSHKKHNPSWKRWDEWDQEWTRKTWQYADMLWACTDPALEFHTDEFLSRESFEFQWSDATKKMFEKAFRLLKTEVKTYNQKTGNNFIVTARLKSLSSCLEKIIEGKKLNDVIGFRVSIEDANTGHFNDIKEISENRLARWRVNMTWEASSNDKWLDAVWKNFMIQNVTFDNKSVLDEQQIEKLQDSISALLPQTTVHRRDHKENPYIKKEEWAKLMKTNYPLVYADSEKRAILCRHYDNFSGGTSRWHNGAYKDFKENITCSYIDDDGESRQKVVELQFDDLENNIWLANYNIRNAERAINTASNSMFMKPLRQVTRMVESHLKKMANQVSGKWEKYSVIDFGNNVQQDISKFVCRDKDNSIDIDKTIVEIINYFIKKGKFIFYSDAKQIITKLPKGLLLAQNLHDSYVADNLFICSNLWLSKQQHSYLLSNWSDRIGIFMPDVETIWWMKLWEILDYMNLGKKKFKELAYIPEGIQTMDFDNKIEDEHKKSSSDSDLE